MKNDGHSNLLVQILNIADTILYHKRQKRLQSMGHRTRRAALQSEDDMLRSDEDKLYGPPSQQQRGAQTATKLLNRLLSKNSSNMHNDEDSSSLTTPQKRQRIEAKQRKRKLMKVEEKGFSNNYSGKPSCDSGLSLSR